MALPRDSGLALTATHRPSVIRSAMPRICQCGARLRHDDTCSTVSCSSFRTPRRGDNLRAPEVTKKRLRTKTRRALPRREPASTPKAKSGSATGVQRRALELMTPSSSDPAAFLATASRAEVAAGTAPRGLAALARAYIVVEGLHFETTPFTAEELVATAVLLGIFYVGLFEGEPERAVRSAVSRSFGIDAQRLGVMECRILTALSPRDARALPSRES